MLLKTVFLMLMVVLAAAQPQPQPQQNRPRPRTRLEIMIDDLVYNVGNVASRINHALFAEDVPRPPPHHEQAIESFPEVTEVGNEIEFDSARQSEDNFHAPNSPHVHEVVNPNIQHSQFQGGPSEDYYDSTFQGSEDFRHNVGPHDSHEQHFHHPQPQRFRPRPPPRAVALGYNLRNMVSNAMTRMRNIWSPNRRRIP